LRAETRNLREGTKNRGRKPETGGQNAEIRDLRPETGEKRQKIEEKRQRKSTFIFDLSLTNKLKRAGNK
jgi:hypothetical protein